MLYNVFDLTIFLLATYKLSWYETTFNVLYCINIYKKTKYCQNINLLGFSIRSVNLFSYITAKSNSIYSDTILLDWIVIQLPSNKRRGSYSLKLFSLFLFQNNSLALFRPLFSLSKKKMNKKQHVYDHMKNIVQYLINRFNTQVPTQEFTSSTKT